MTQQERAQIWARKDELMAALDRMPATEENAKARKYIQNQIEQCTVALLTDKIERSPDSH